VQGRQLKRCRCVPVCHLRSRHAVRAEH
jgi:hypothetical protein